MKITVKRPVELDVRFVRLVVPVDDGEMPQGFPFVANGVWDATIDIDTGRFYGWPGMTSPFPASSCIIHIKPVDRGCYYLLGEHDVVLASLEQEYVPHGVVPGKYGDYIVMDVSPAGVVRNWPKRPTFDEFFPDE